MAITVSLALIDAPIANKPTTVQANVTNTSASSVTLNTLYIAETTEADCTITQPIFYTPNVALGVGNPTILAGATFSVTFEVVFSSPNGAGVSPNTFPSPAGAFVGQPPTDSCTLTAFATVSDLSVGTGSVVAAPLSATAPFPPVATGTLQLQFNQGFNAIGLALGL